MSVWTVELRKALANRWFALSVFVGCVFAVASAVGNIGIALDDADWLAAYAEHKDAQLSARTLYRFLMVTDYIQWSTDLFYTVLPLLAVVPYGWSLSQELRSGYVYNTYVRLSRKKMLAAKACAAFASGSLAVGIPLILNVIVCACFIPAYEPDVETVFLTSVYDTVMWSELYYTTPVQYIFQYLVLNMGFCGLWAALVQLSGLVFRDGFRLVAGSSLVLFLFGALERELAIALTGSELDYVSFSPLLFMRGCTITANTGELSVIAWLAAMLFACTACVLLVSRRDAL